MTPVLVLAGASNASAQASLTTSSPSWSYQRVISFSPARDGLPVGVRLDGAMHFGKFGLVAEGGWALHGEEDEEGDVTDFEFTTNMWHLAAGPGSPVSVRRLWAAGQVLWAGHARAASS
jgi:hypothetical protein